MTAARAGWAAAAIAGAALVLVSAGLLTGGPGGQFRRWAGWRPSPSAWACSCSPAA